MADIFDEIKDDIKQEKYERLITVHGPRIISAAAILVLCVAGYKIYNSIKYEDSLEKGKVFYDAFEGSKPELYDELINSDHEGFKILSAFSKAGISKSKGKVDEAIKELEGAEDVGSSNKSLAEYATLTKLFLLTTSESQWKGKEEDINSQLKELSGQSSPFAVSAKQVHAMFLLKQGKKDSARELFSELALLENIPPSIVERSRKFIKIIDGE